MNSYSLHYKWNVTDGKMTNADFLKAVTIGSVLSPNFSVMLHGNGNQTFTFDLPFSLSNLNIEPIVYDTRFQSVKEFIDKPYAVAGRVVSLLIRDIEGAYDVKKDFDDYMVINGITNYASEDPNEPQYSMYIGIVNSTLTETYSPFGARGSEIGEGIVAMKIFDANDLKKAIAQVNCSKAGSLSGVSMTATLPNYQSPPFNPNLSLTQTLNR